jgi:hypothetical protein
MSIYTDNVYHRKIWESVYGTIPKDSEGRSYEIHHIDGNHKNNHISNLLCVSIHDHYNIHYSQGDVEACLIMSKRMRLSATEKSRLAKIANAGANNPSHGKYWWTNGVDNIKATKCPVGYRRGRTISEDHQKSFNKRNQSGKNNPSYGTYWWTNGIDSVKSKDCPANGWYRGQGAIPKTTNKANTGRFWWTNGMAAKMSVESPGPEWYRGKTVRA